MRCSGEVVLYGTGRLVKNKGQSSNIDSSQCLRDGRVVRIDGGEYAHEHLQRPKCVVRQMRSIVHRLLWRRCLPAAATLPNAFKRKGQGLGSSSGFYVDSRFAPAPAVAHDPHGSIPIPPPNPLIYAYLPALSDQRRASHRASCGAGMLRILCRTCL